MNVNHEAIIGLGWKLTHDNYDNIATDEKLFPVLEELINNGYLHYINTYCDNDFCVFLGIKTYCLIPDSEIVELDNIIPDLPIEQKTKLQAIAKKYFKIVSPPKVCLILGEYIY